ncbi:MAG: VWA domain-containing protein [Planctomycetota bacterium]
MSLTLGFVQFLSLGWLLAAPALIGGLVLLYFLKLKRREVAISSTYLWRDALDDLRVNSPFQRLRMNLVLILQLLALLALILALARPVSPLGGLTGSDMVLLIDISASMQTADAGGQTRFEHARGQALRVVDDLSYGDRAIVIAFADEARVLTDLTESKNTLRQALEALVPTDRGTKLGNALHRVRPILDKAKDRSPVLYVFSDGRVGPLEGVALDKDVPLHYVRVGDEGENLGIVGVDVHLASGFGDETRVFAAVQNTGTQEVTCGLDFYLDDELKGSREVSLKGGGISSLPFDAPLGDKVRRVRLKLDHKDAFPLDDEVVAVLRPPEPLKVLLVSGGNLFLHRALSEDPRVAKTAAGSVPTVAPEEWKKELAEGMDVVVLDRITPEELAPGSYLCFGARPPFEGFEDLGQIENTQILDWDETHPVTRFVNFSTLELPTARRFKPREADKVLVRSTYGPLVIEARAGERHAIAIAFNLLELPVEGAWTFDPSYPIFLSNVIRYLAGSGEGRRKDVLVQTGSVAELPYPKQATLALVDGPGGGKPTTLKIVPGDELLRVPGLDRQGLYAVSFVAEEGGDPVRTTQFAANLADAEESSILPARKLVLEAGKREEVASDKAVETNKDMWKYVAAAALLFVMLEWWIYNRRVFV